MAVKIVIDLLDSYYEEFLFLFNGICNQKFCSELELWYITR